MTQWGLDTLFNPAKRHMDEEKRRLQTTREQIGDSSGGKRIDLESGKVTIRRDDPAAEPAAPSDPAPSTAPGRGTSTPSAEPAESAARARARRRVAARKAQATSRDD